MIIKVFGNKKNPIFSTGLLIWVKTKLPIHIRVITKLPNSVSEH
jgi:hypothetical protein